MQWEDCSLVVCEAFSTPPDTFALPLCYGGPAVLYSGTFTIRRADCGAPRHRTPEFEEAVLHAVEEDTATSRNLAGWLSGVLRMSSSYTPRRYRQCSYRILHHESTSIGGSCTVVRKIPTSHGGFFSLMKSSSTGKLFSVHVTVMFGLMKTRSLRASMCFTSDTVRTFELGFWMDVWLGHTFFHQILRVPHTYDSLKAYCMGGSCKIYHCMRVET